MTDAEYLFKQTEITRKRDARGTFNKKRQGGKYVRMPSDNLTKKEREQMNGEVIKWQEKPFYTWEEFKALPEDVQLKWLNSVINVYDVGLRSISRIVFEMSPANLGLYLRNRPNIKNYVNTGKATGSAKAQKSNAALAKAVKDYYSKKNAQVETATVTPEAVQPDVIPHEKPAKNVIITPEKPEPDVILLPKAAYTVPAKPEKEPAKGDLHNIALLLQSLQGTGAKVVIEFSL